MTDARVLSLEELCPHRKHFVDPCTTCRQQRAAGRAEGEALVRKALGVEPSKASPGVVWVLAVAYVLQELSPKQRWALTGEGERPKETE